jgi:glutamate/aspartate transport system substrate-binding protein
MAIGVRLRATLAALRPPVTPAMPSAFARLAGALSLAVVFAAAAVPAVAADGPTLERIRSTGTIALAYREGAAPFSFKDREGRVRGYSVELCMLVVASIQKSLGLPSLRIDWRPVDAATRLFVVANGEADIECGTTTITLSRMEKVDFSVPIFVDGGSVLVKRDAKVGKLADLKGRRVAVIPATTTEEALTRELAAAGVTATLVPVRDGAEGMAALQGGKADALAGDRIVLAGLRQRARNPEALAFVADDFSFEPYALVIRRDDPDFRLAVNRALVGVYKSGDIDAVFQRWLAPLGRPGRLLHAMYYLQRLPE